VRASSREVVETPEIEAPEFVETQDQDLADSYVAVIGVKSLKRLHIEMDTGKMHRILPRINKALAARGGVKTLELKDEDKLFKKLKMTVEFD
jgi:hypothetical protein